ncbi:hypothetical protein [Halohasta litorea]|uniref:DUF8121 domain-containing protein n=1 Tax=Halohasta litorea TaxID=869891 RepID=A0ABD6D4I7_9EURY|nr:hypothetical protein [Halohasta litorea]MEA1931343.1 hypothetical protein [Euryarchaeota archaeon]
MNRRQFLATTAIPVGITTAGCAANTGRTVELEAETERQDDGQQNETYLVYRHDSEEVRVVGFNQGSFPQSLDDRFGFGMFIEYDESTTLESFRFDLRAPPTGEPADIYLASPTGAVWPNLTYGRVDGEGSARIALSDAPDVTDETVFINTFVDPNTAPVEQIAIDLELELTAPDGPATYRAETTTTFEPETR